MGTGRSARFAASLVVGGMALAPAALDAAGPDPANPKVHVVSGKHLVVDQEPIFVPLGRKNFTITWQLPAGAGYEFVPNDANPAPGKTRGIDIAAPEGEFTCTRASGLRIACKFRNETKGKYKYTIRVKGKEGVLELDPFIMNG
jgi:hypothetical protein